MLSSASHLLLSNLTISSKHNPTGVSRLWGAPVFYIHTMNRRALTLLLSILVLLTDALSQERQAFQRLTVEDELPSNTVRNIIQDQQGFIWLGTDNGLCRYDGTTVRLFRIAENGMDQYVTALQANGDSLTVSTNSGVYSFSPRTEKFRRLPGAKQQKTGRGDQLQTSDGQQWTGTWENGLMLTKQGGQLQQVLNPQRDGLGHHIHKLYEYDDRYLLIGCDEGLVAYDRQNGSAALWKTPKFVYAIEGDHEGGLWIGTFYDGVYYLNVIAQRLERTPGHVISRFCEDGEGRLWIASDDAGLNCLKDDIPQSFTNQAILQRGNIHALLADGERLWVGTYSDGIYCLAGDRTRHYTTADGLYDNSSYVIYQDRQQRLWAATMDGLCRYDEPTDRFLPVRKLGAVAISMASERNSLWIATQGAGLYRFDGKTWQQYRHSTDTTSINDDQVNCVLLTRGGQLWVATQSGLCLYQHDSNCFKRVGDIAVNAIVEDADGDDLWLSAATGVLKFSPKTGRSVLFTREDGLISTQFQPNAGFRDSQGYVYFGTTNGYSRFLPSTIHTNKLQPRVYITGLEVFNRAASVGDELMPEALAYSGHLELSYSDRMFSLHYTALSYASPSKNQYAYRLDGFDHDWNYVGSQTKATYTNLPPGKYTFRVKATNNDGLWSEEEAVLTVVVRPPFWLTWWAKTLYVLLVAGALWWLMRLRLRRVEHRRHREELDRIAGIAGNPSNNEFLVRMNSIIEQNFANPELNVNFLAEQMAISRSGLFAKTKTLADVTPNEMIQIVRLKQAAQLLSKGGLTVSEVCYRVGFSSPSYFTKCFTKQFGVKPTEWKEGGKTNASD